MPTEPAINRSLSKRDPTAIPIEPSKPALFDEAIEAFFVSRPQAPIEVSDPRWEALSPKPLPPLRPRAARALGHEIFINLATIELSGHEDRATSFDCEIEFYIASKGSPQTHDDPGSPDEYEVAGVRPYVNPIDPTTGRRGTMREYLPCPEWLEELLVDLVDVSRLDAERS